MPTTEIRDVLNYHHVREEVPSDWVDTGINGRTPRPGLQKARLRIRRSDGTLQNWIFAEGGIYVIAAVGVIIRGKIQTPVPPI